MLQIINEDLETLRLSKQYIFSDKNLPNQVFIKKFDMYIFMEDVHIKSQDFLDQFKILEKKIGGSNIFLHTIEPYLADDEQSELFVKDFIPPCFKLNCDEIDLPNEIWNLKWDNGECYDWNKLQIVFGETAEWGCFFSTMYDEYGVIGLNNSIVEELKNSVPYVLEKCFYDIENLLHFVEWLSKKETYSERKNNLIENYSMSPIFENKILSIIKEYHNE